MFNVSPEAWNLLAKVGLATACATTVALLVALMRRSARREKRLAIRTYARRVGRFLRTRYGLQENYTPAQVQGMIKEWGYSTGYDQYGLAMYCDAAAFMNHYRATGRRYNYELLRGEISRCLFRADMTFSVSDVIEVSAQSKKKRLAIHCYIKQLGPALRQRYGVQRKYTPAQVKQTVSYSCSRSDDDCYALALYCDAADFVDYHSLIGEACDYKAMRSEIAHSFHPIFQGSTTFDACEVIDRSDRLDNAKDESDGRSWWSNLLDFESGSDLSSGGSATSCNNDFSSGSDIDYGSD
ncbi:hypothetical protein H6F76_23360 [Leptolyngbya sp. FACHB-321]|uniref:DUF6559 family protein n=1 Tax=Leptolyngbya sp. FACHB-321 TaxID=2692807 RepID=UPI0016820F39|nr:DUF6559 family protein [Leptolyngbya sp. FACHB-321]MBD2037896.1 hypothetical protein [Leptolyngbya sp. FACHB-321]